MRVLILVPTTGALNRVLRIKARPDLAASGVYLPRDYIPLAITRDYDILTSRAGPLAALGAPVKPGPHWLWLAGPIDSGESWQLPVLLAHLVVAHGDELVEDPAQADLVLWSTGAVDAELRIVEHDYKLPAKAAYSRAELQTAVAAGAKIIGILPHCEAAAPLRSLFAEAGVQHPVVERVGDVAAARRLLEAALNRSVRVRRWKSPLAAIGAAAFGAITLGAVALGASGKVPAELTEMLPVQIKHMLGLAVTSPPPVKDENVAVVTPPTPPDDPGPRKNPDPPQDGDTHFSDAMPPVAAVPAVPVQAEELRDPRGRHCMSVLIEHLPPRRLDVGVDGSDRFHESAGLNLCGLEWSLKDAEAAQSGIQGFDIDLPESPSVRLIRTGSPGAWTKIRIEFTREFSRTITYNVRMKFAGTQPPGQVQEFHHTIR